MSTEGLHNPFDRLPLEQVSIVGLGLLGASVGLACKRLGLARHVIGWSPHERATRAAAKVGAYDGLAESLTHVVGEAEVIVLAAPVGALPKIMEELGPAYAESGVGVVTDVGSTKRTVVAAGARWLPEVFVGAHPMAGGEKSGAEHARADLFDGAACALCPADADPNMARWARLFWTHLGCRVTEMTADAHDRAVARVSHLPHAVAGLLVRAAADDLALAGRGFADTTRVAAGDAALWRDILVDNRDFVAHELRLLARQANHLAALLDAGDAPAVEALLAEAARCRRDVR